MIVKHGLKSIADCRNDVEEYIAACAFKDDVSTDDYLDIAERLIRHWRPKEALQWIDNSIEMPTAFPWGQNKKT